MNHNKDIEEINDQIRRALILQEKASDILSKLLKKQKGGVK